MQLIVALTLVIVALPAAASCAYLLVLTLLSKRPSPSPASARRMRFDIIVPAHNEEAVLERLLGTLERLDWPKERYQVLVVADNCTDNTASLARHRGACVIERRDPQRRGKGYALQLAFQASRSRQFAEAVVVVDADAEVTPNLLEAIATRMERGAHAVQVHYGVSNPSASWRTRLLTIAKGAVHIVRSRARERLRLSCGIRGNGWSVTHRLLGQVPYGAFSLTEDVEYGIELGLAGHRVHYADEASANAEMVTREREARQQRQRWERGRFRLMRSKSLALLHTALRTRSLVCLDLALDLLVPPLSYVTLNVMLLTGLALFTGGPGFTRIFAVYAALSCWLCIVSYILRGWQLSGIGPRGLLDLAGAPFYVAWKLLVMIGGRERTEWTRTKREQT